MHFLPVYLRLLRAFRHSAHLPPTLLLAAAGGNKCNQLCVICVINKKKCIYVTISNTCICYANAIKCNLFDEIINIVPSDQFESKLI